MSIIIKIYGNQNIQLRVREDRIFDDDHGATEQLVCSYKTGGPPEQ